LRRWSLFTFRLLLPRLLCLWWWTSALGCILVRLLSHLLHRLRRSLFTYHVLPRLLCLWWRTSALSCVLVRQLSHLLHRLRTLHVLPGSLLRLYRAHWLIGLSLRLSPFFLHLLPRWSSYSFSLYLLLLLAFCGGTLGVLLFNPSLSLLLFELLHLPASIFVASRCLGS
jgi:hypothetical protein